MNPNEHGGHTGRVNDGWSLPRVFGRWMVLGIVLAIVAVGLGATAVLYHQSENEAAREEEDLVIRSSRVLQASSGALAAALAGASAVVEPSGDVLQARFETFAKGAISTTRVPVLAFVPLITDDERVAFEAAAGLSITEPGANGLIAAEDRPEYLPVQFVYPITDTSRRVVGFDTGSDAVRLATSNAAKDAGELVFSEPVPSQPSGQTSVFFAEPLFTPGAPLETVEQRRAAIIGFATGLTPSRTLLASVVDQLPGGARVSIVDGDAPLAITDDAPSGGHSIQIEQGGRTWTITVEYDSAAHGMTWLMLIATIILAAAVGYFLMRNLRQTRELHLAATNVRQLGRLSEQLAVADEREQINRTILEQTAAMVGARSVTLSVLVGEDWLQVDSSLRTGDGDGLEVLPTTEMRLDPDTPSGLALTTNAPVYVTDASTLRTSHPSAVPAWTAAGLESGVAMPVRRPNGETMGVIEWAWTRPRRLRAGVRSTLLTMAEVCQQGLYRAEVQERRWRSASALSDLSQMLSVSRTLEQIADVVIRLGAHASGADHVAIGFVNDAGNELQVFHSSIETDEAGPFRFEFPIDPGGELLKILKRGQPIRFDGAEDLERFPAIHELVGERLRRITCIPLIDADTQLRGVIAFVYLFGSDLRLQPEAGRLDTIADLAAQTVERSLLYQHEHELVVNLQRQTLAALPEVAGLRIAARYLPASSLLGLGGDWYDVYVLDDGRIGVVVGDVAGHGIDAIADMTEFRTTISTLLRTNSDLGSLPAMSTTLLNDDGETELRFATAGLMILDVAAARVSYIRAGHPPAMLRTPAGDVVVLEAGGGAPIGIASTPVIQHELELPGRSVLVAYTDGLIERRDESIDVGLARLASAVRECRSDDPDVIADAIIDACLGGRQTEDDTALLVIVVE